MSAVGASIFPTDVSTTCRLGSTATSSLRPSKRGGAHHHQLGQRGHNLSNMWREIVEEAKRIAEREEFLSDFMHLYVIDHPSYSSAMALVLAKEFGCEKSHESWHKLFSEVITRTNKYDDQMDTIERMGLFDLAAVKERDPSCDSLVNPFLYFKGFKALQSHRAAHWLWIAGRRDVARAIQSRCSELYNVDIHPGAKIDSGLMLDHGTGTVVGETATIGRNCSFLHGVTLGSTGKERGDRHPKIGHDVLIGCNATLLGNISVGDSCKIGSGSIVLRSLPPGVTAVGNPARIVGNTTGESSGASVDWALNNVVTPVGGNYNESWQLYADGI